MLINLLPFLAFTSLLIINYKRVGRVIALSNYIIALYSLSTLSFYFCALSDHSVYYNTEALILSFFFTCILVYPLQNFESKGHKLRFSVVNLNRLKQFVACVCILSFIAIIFFGKNVGQLANANILEMRSARMSLYQGGTLISKISCFGAYISLIAIPLLYWNYITKSLSVKYTRLLFISSIAFVLYTLNVAGRDGLVIWFLIMLGNYCFFSQWMSVMQKKVFKKILVCMCVVILPLFLYISSARFSQSEGGVTGSFMSYLGQSLHTLSYNIDNAHAINHKASNSGNTIALYDVLRGNTKGRFDSMDDGANMGFITNGFSFYVGSFYPYNLSISATILVMLIFLFIYARMLRIKGNTIDSSRLIVALLWYNILIIGVFYFYFGTLIGNVYLLFTLLIPLFLKR